MIEQGGDTRIDQLRRFDAALKRIEELEALAQGYDTAREVFTDRIEALENENRELRAALEQDKCPSDK